VRERERRRAADVLLPHLVRAVERGEARAAARGHDVAAHAVDAQRARTRP
jgi:hypothetical protein